MSEFDDWSPDQKDINDVNDFLEQGGIPGAPFENIGDTWYGQVVRAAKVQSRDFETRELQTWDDGAPKYELQVDIQTDTRDPDIAGDDGIRRLYVRSNMLNAIRGALRAKREKLLPGGYVKVTFTGEGTPTRRGAKPPKLYSAEYTPGTLSAGISADDLA